MPTGWDHAGSLLSGPLAGAAAPWPFALRAVLCDLRPRFLPKTAVGPERSPPAGAFASGRSVRLRRSRGRRAVARNGRVLLCSDQPPDALAGRVASVRLQTWHRAILPGDLPAPYGVLLCVRCLDRAPVPGPPLFVTRLVHRAAAAGDLRLDLGGGLVLEFRADN